MRRAASRGILALAVLLVLGGASLVAAAAVAAPVPETGEQGVLTLSADPYPAENLVIERGERLLWPVTADLDAATTGQLSVRVVSTEPLAEDPAALRFELASCPQAWALPATPGGTATCAGGAGDVAIAESAFATTDAGEEFPLGAIEPGVPRYLLVTLSLPLSTPGSVADQPAELAFGFTATGGAAGITSPAARLAETGAPWIGPALLGLGLLLGGGALGAARGSSPEVAR